MVISPIEAVRERLRKWGKRGNCGNDDKPMTSLPRNDQTDEPPENSLQASVREQPEVAFFSGTCGILDTGASKSVIGSTLLPALIESFTHMCDSWCSGRHVTSRSDLESRVR